MNDGTTTVITQRSRRAWWLTALLLSSMVACSDEAEPASGTDASSGRPQSGRDTGTGEEEEEEEDPGRELPDAGDGGGAEQDVIADAPDLGTPDTVGQDTRPETDSSTPADTGSTADTAPVDAGPSEVSPEVQEAIDNAVAASETTRDTFCACYQSGAPYNGSEAACRAELNGISVTILPCDAAIAATWPADALAFYECRRTVADSLNRCFTGCGTRESAILSCVLPNALEAVGCGDGRDPAFVTAYEACHP